MKSMYHNAPVFSQLFLVASGMCFILNLFGQHVCYNLFSLSSAQILHGFEFWRLLTFPLATTSFESFLLLTLSVGLFSSILEITFSTKRFVLCIAALVASQGLLYTIAFSSAAQPVVLSGGDSISFFVMALFTFVLPTRNIAVWRGIEIRGLHIIFAIVFFSFCASIYKPYHNAADAFYYGAISSAFGVAFAVFLTSVLHQRLKRIRQLGKVQIHEASDERFLEQEEELVSSFGRADRSYSKAFYADTDENEEEMMNRLLDKIFENGQESLTPEEKSFLEDYSQRLR